MREAEIMLSILKSSPRTKMAKFQGEIELKLGRGLIIKIIMNKKAKEE